MESTNTHPEPPAQVRLRARRLRSGRYLVRADRPGRVTTHECSRVRFAALEERLRARGQVSGHWQGGRGFDLYLW